MTGMRRLLAVLLVLGGCGVAAAQDTTTTVPQPVPLPILDNVDELPQACRMACAQPTTTVPATTTTTVAPVLVLPETL